MAFSISSESLTAELQDQSWHEKNGWVAEKFFSDPQVIQLCKSIEANDLDAIKVAIDGGVDVNALGKDNMTPLLWAFPENHPERMKILLKAGANPNVFIKSNLGIPGMFQIGDSVTHMAARSVFDCFDIVFDHGGDPNLPSGIDGNPPIFTVIKEGGPSTEERKRRIKKLVELGGDINFPGSERMGGGPPVYLAASWGGQYDLASFLLDIGAIPKTYNKRGVTTLSHTLAAELMNPNGILAIGSKAELMDPKGELAIARKECRQRFDALVAKLLKMGVDVEEAKLDQMRRTNLGVNMKELQERENVFVSVADAFMLRNGVPRLPKHADQFLKDFETRIGKRFDEYTIYKWVELELLDDQGNRVAFDRPGDRTYPKKKMDRFHSDLVAVRWTDKGQFSDVVFIKIKPDDISFPRVLENARTVPKFRVANDRVGSSASIAGYKNRDVLPSGTVFENESWMEIMTNEKATEIVSVKDLPRLPFVTPKIESEPSRPPIAAKTETQKDGSPPTYTFRLDFDWKAEDYFEDPKAIELCRAIEVEDYTRIDELLDQGIDINLRGKDNMTFLLWSFPVIGTSPRSDKCSAHLLKRGADPNVKFKGDFGTDSKLRAGDSVTSLSVFFQKIETLKSVLEHGGDPNIKDSQGMTLMHNTIKVGTFGALDPRTINQLKLLLEQGAEIDSLNADGETPAMYATRWFGQYDVALFLLEKGASHEIENPNTNQRLIHYVVAEASKKDRFKKDNVLSDKPTYDRLLKYLVDKGESIEEIVAEIKRQKSEKK